MAELVVNRWLSLSKPEIVIGYMYILECSDGSYYVGSTKNFDLRIQQHQNALGANHTKKLLPVKLVYYEEFPRIDYAFYREKQVQGWRREKKETLINGEFDKLPELAKAYNNVGFDRLNQRGNDRLNQRGNDRLNQRGNERLNEGGKDNLNQGENDKPS